MIRVFLWLFAAPTLALLLVAAMTALTPKIAVASALIGQALGMPCWRALERRRTLQAIRRHRHQPNARVVRVPFDARDEAFQLLLRALAAIAVAAVTLFIVR